MHLCVRGIFFRPFLRQKWMIKSKERIEFFFILSFFLSFFLCPINPLSTRSYTYHNAAAADTAAGYYFYDVCFMLLFSDDNNNKDSL